MKINIAPSILSCDLANIASEIRRVEDAGADSIHIDVMDGHFVKNLTMGIPVIESIRKITKLELDVHLMIDNPDDFVTDYLDAGADTISFHVESVALEKAKRKLNEGYTVVFLDDQLIDEERYLKVVDRIKGAGKKASLAFNPSTMMEVIDPKLLAKLDMVLIMTVWPGFGGQKFIKFTEEKIKVARRSNPNIDIEVDGGVNLETSVLAAKSGANVFVMGTYVFKSQDVKMTISSVRKAVGAVA